MHMIVHVCVCMCVCMCTCVCLCVALHNLSDLNPTSCAVLVVQATFTRLHLRRILINITTVFIAFTRMPSNSFRPFTRAPYTQCHYVFLYVCMCMH